MAWLTIVLFLAVIPLMFHVQYERARPDLERNGFRVHYSTGAIVPWPGLLDCLEAADAVMNGFGAGHGFYPLSRKRRGEIWIIVHPPDAVLGRRRGVVAKTSVKRFFWGLKRVVVVEVKQARDADGVRHAAESGLFHELSIHVMPFLAGVGLNNELGADFRPNPAFDGRWRLYADRMVARLRV